jgi:hypothetical protein
MYELRRIWSEAGYELSVNLLNKFISKDDGKTVHDMSRPYAALLKSDPKYNDFLDTLVKRAYGDRRENDAGTYALKDGRFELEWLGWGDVDLQRPLTSAGDLLSPS